MTLLSAYVSTSFTNLSNNPSFMRSLEGTVALSQADPLWKLLWKSNIHRTCVFNWSDNTYPFRTPLCLCKILIIKT
jgi:hypothetical protein